MNGEKKFLNQLMALEEAGEATLKRGAIGNEGPATESQGSVEHCVPCRI